MQRFLIVGQGLAGTLLAYFLRKAGGQIWVVDDQHQSASSRAAAGIINPITGRKYVKSWRIDDLLPVAVQTYQALEQQFGATIFHPRNVLRAISNAKESNDWSLHTLEPGYKHYIAEEVNLGNYQNNITLAYGYGEVLHGAQVDLPLLIGKFRQWLQKEGSLTTETFDFEQLIIEAESIRYQNLIADKIIFCEGAKGKFNPFFNYLPFHGDKGEALIVRIPDAHFEKILKQQIFIVPLGKDDLYWIGATYERHYPDDQPSEQGRQYLTRHLQQVLKIPFEIVQHLAAVRPTVRDRRPLLGLHPQFSQVGIFNGLGTKGASLGPFWAQHFANFLLTGASLDREADIRRFG